MTTVGCGAYSYEPVENWAKLPPGWSFKEIGGVGVDRDYPLHRFFLLTEQVEFTLGSASDSLRRLGRLLADEPV